MSQALALLEDALAMALKEKTALEEGAYESAIDLAEQRNRITDMAWNAMKAGEENVYRTKLLEISKIQTHLAQFATNARDQIRASLNRSRQEKKRIKGYHMAVEQALQ